MPISPATLAQIRDNDSTLTALNLNYPANLSEPLNDDDINQLVQAMRNNTHINYIALTNNLITDIGATHLSHLPHTVITLDLGCNSNISAIGAISIINNTRLHILGIHYTNISSLLDQRSGLIAAFNNNLTLTQVNLTGTGLELSEIQIINEYTQRNVTRQLRQEMQALQVQQTRERNYIQQEIQAQTLEQRNYIQQEIQALREQQTTEIEDEQIIRLLNIEIERANLMKKKQRTCYEISDGAIGVTALTLGIFLYIQDSEKFGTFQISGMIFITIGVLLVTNSMIHKAGQFSNSAHMFFEKVGRGFEGHGFRFVHVEVAPALTTLLESGAIAPELKSIFEHGAIAPQLKTFMERGAIGPELRALMERGAVGPELRTFMENGAIGRNLRTLIERGAVAPELRNFLERGAVRGKASICNIL